GFSRGGAGILSWWGGDSLVGGQEPPGRPVSVQMSSPIDSVSSSAIRPSGLSARSASHSRAVPDVSGTVQFKPSPPIAPPNDHANRPSEIGPTLSPIVSESDALEDSSK